MSALETHKTPLYPYEVLTTLCELWLAFCRVATVSDFSPKKTSTGRRMAVFLQYIANHYGEEVYLDDLAQSAHVSKSECLRCFKSALQTTPYKYLMEYRLSKAAELLRNTDMSVGEIAAAVGFQQVSHFGKCFREKTGLSPRQYRKE